VLAVVFDVKNICRTVKTKRQEQAGKERISVCVERADLVIERVGLAQRIRIQLDEVNAGSKKQNASVSRNFLPRPIRSASGITQQMRTAIGGGFDQVVSANCEARA
jgi:hypothetical protein